MKLKDLRVVFICPAHNEKYVERRDYMFQLLKSLGFKDVYMFKSGQNYPACVSKANRDILSCNMDDQPFLLLEDDIELSEWANLDLELEMPPDTDAFYLGFSKYGVSYTKNDSAGYNSVQIQPINDNYIRVINMLGAHAIVFVSKRFKKAVFDIMDDCIHTKIIPDIKVARIQKDFNVYGYHYPVFFQSDGLGNNWYAKDATNFRF